VSYKVKPVASYEDLSRAKTTIQTEDVRDYSTPIHVHVLVCSVWPHIPPCSVPQVSTVIMINCGGTVDLMEFLEPPSTVTIYVFDNHRPYHLQNVREHNTQVIATWPFHLPSFNSSSGLVTLVMPISPRVFFFFF
jgi:hypothetical protein